MSPSYNLLSRRGYLALNKALSPTFTPVYTTKLYFTDHDNGQIVVICKNESKQCVAKNVQKVIETFGTEALCNVQFRIIA